jgi:DNA processing protein
MEIELLLALLITPGLKPKSIRDLFHAETRPLSHAGGESSDSSLNGLPSFHLPEIPIEAREKAVQILHRAESEGISIIPLWDSRYPERLKIIDHPPLVIYLKGDPACLRAPHTVTIVGTREPTGFGVAWAEEVSKQFTSCGFVVVSGLAVGCDTAAHQGCLKAGGRTAAVLAHGLDMVHPPSNDRLAAVIVERGGCLVSEHPPGVRPKPRYFVMRNRLQAALGDAVVVVETGLSGGTPHTVAACLKQDKPLFCLKHPPLYHSHPQVQGNKKFLKEPRVLPLVSEPDVKAAIDQLIGI